mmetsp:Transcript_30574/g.69962  ORF Transcript_30574/g.69962 Transcript_30574/m.69962 type:complete len:340 (-) Transcript_30574:55-1074(-)
MPKASEDKDVGRASQDVVVRHIEHDSATTFQTICGGLVISAFIFVWMASLMSPLLLYISVVNSRYTSAFVIVALTVVAYLPWKRGPLTDPISKFVDGYHQYYYSSSSITFEGDVPDPKKNEKTFYAVHPHGAFCLGWSMLYHNPIFINTKFCFSPALLASPLFRIWSRITGNSGGADKASMVRCMKDGMGVALPPGGFEEATITSTAHDRVYIKKRAGFIKICLQHGYSIRPAYAFGERHLYSNVQGLWGLRHQLNKFGVPTIAIAGLWAFPLLPKRPRNVGLHVVVGRKMFLPKIENPTKDDVKEWHQKYISSLSKLFEDHKEKFYGNEAKTTKLEIW